MDLAADILEMLSVEGAGLSTEERADVIESKLNEYGRLVKSIHSRVSKEISESLYAGVSSGIGDLP